MQPGELLMACEIPLIAEGERQAFSELARRQGDYAVAGLAARARVRRQHACATCAWPSSSLGDRPIRARAAEAALQGGAIDDARLALADAALRAELDPFDDLTHSAAAKKQLAATLMRRAVARLDAARTPDRSFHEHPDRLPEAPRARRRQRHADRARGRVPQAPDRLPARGLRPEGLAPGLRARRVRRLHRAAGRPDRARLPGARGAGRRPPRRHHRDAEPGQAAARRCRTPSSSTTRCSAATARRAC